MRQSSPFDFEPNPEEDKDALTQALRIVRDFALYFVVSEVSRVRPRLMDEIAARFPDQRIQRIRVTKETTNLLHLLQDELENPLPDIVFVSGFESVISAAAEPRSHPLLLNLNFTRNNFYALLPRPVVFWVPPFVLKAISQGAPDFVSVRSGVYTFALEPEERSEMARIAATVGHKEIMGLLQPEREDRISEMLALLSDYRSLPVHQRNALDEAQILNQLGMAFTSLGKYSEAQERLIGALDRRRRVLGPDHPDLALSLNNLAGLYKIQGRYAEAELLYGESIAIHRRNQSGQEAGLSASLNNLAELYKEQGRHVDAEILLDEALQISHGILPSTHPLIAISINNLAGVYVLQGRYDEAEEFYKDALARKRADLPPEHPDIATGLNNLGRLYYSQGRYQEAESLLLEALGIRRDHLPLQHPLAANTLNNLAELYVSQARYADAFPLYVEALGILDRSLGRDHPTYRIIEANFENAKGRSGQTLVTNEARSN